jgi:hypothetical protein
MRDRLIQMYLLTATVLMMYMIYSLMTLPGLP